MDQSKKKAHFLWVAGGSSLSPTHQNLMFFKFQMAISGGIHWMAPSVCMLLEDLGVS